MEPRRARRTEGGPQSPEQVDGQVEGQPAGQLDAQVDPVEQAPEETASAERPEPDDRRQEVEPTGETSAVPVSQPGPDSPVPQPGPDEPAEGFVPPVQADPDLGTAADTPPSRPGTGRASGLQPQDRSAMRAGMLRAVGFGILALVVGAGASLVPRQQPSLSDVASVVPGQTLVCPSSQQDAQIAAASTSPSLQIGGLTGAARDVRVPMSGSIGTAARLVRSVSGQGRPTATTMSVIGAGATATSSWTSCVTASTGGTVIVADPSVSDILVTNPESEDTTVDVTLSGAKGTIEAAGSRGITVAARTSKVLPLSVWAPGTSPVSATVSTDTGRIVAVARSRGTAGAETTATTAAAQNLYIPAVPAGATASELLVSNPGTARATAKVTAMAPGGAFTPEGADQIEIEPNTTIAVDVGKALSGEAVGLSVSANIPVSAQLMATKGKDFAMATPAAAATSLQTALPRGGTASLSNPTDQTAQISGTYRTTTGQTVKFTASLAAGTTWTKDLGGTGGHLMVTSDHAIIGGAWFSGAGLSSVPMSVVSAAVKGNRIAVDPQLS